MKQTKSKGMAQVIRKRRIFILLMLAWPVLHLLLEWYLNFDIIYMAFRSYTNDIIHGEFVGFDNFEGIFNLFNPKTNTVPEYYALIHCLQLIFLVVFINAPISLAFAYLLYLKVKGYKILRFTLYIPVITSAVVLVLAYRQVFQPDGPINFLYNYLGLKWPQEGFFSADSAWKSILAFSIWTGFSTNIIYFLSCMRRVPESYIESAKLDGASEPRVFFSVILPLASPTICTMLSLGIAGVFSWALPSLLFVPQNGGAYNVGTMGLSILNFTMGRNYGLAASYGLMLTIIACPLMLSIRKLSHKLENSVEY
ncbi:MAG: sugar ABC transporter permease [Clostridia bacterium]|nr:sugar ABC transporter permease [Clostridia bacterium]